MELIFKITQKLFHGKFRYISRLPIIGVIIYGRYVAAGTITQAKSDDFKTVFISKTNTPNRPNKNNGDKPLIFIV